MEKSICKKAVGVIMTFFMIFSLLIIPSTNVKADGNNQVKIDILSVNDFHGALEDTPKTDDKGNVYAEQGASVMAGKVDEVKNSNPNGTILVSAGDMSQGTPISNVLKGKPVMEMMNKMGFEFMTLGNHEFDWGLDTLNEMKSEANFPFLACNVYDKTTGKRVTFAEPYKIVERQGVKVAFIGAVTNEDVYVPTVVKNLEFRDPATEVNKAVDEVKAQGVDTIVVVAHCGAYQDDKGNITGQTADMAKKLDNTKVSAIICGHSHTQVAGTVNGIAIVQAWKEGRNVGHVALTYDTNTKKVVSCTAEDLDCYNSYASIKKDADVASIVKTAEDQVGTQFKQVIGSAASSMTFSTKEESAVGNFAIDAMTKAVKADFGFETSGDIRVDSIQKGQYTLGNLYEMLPWDNYIMTMKLTGAQVKEILENGVTLKYGIVQASGLKFKYDSSKKAGERVYNITLPNGKPVNMKKEYTVAVNDYLQTGGDEYNAFTKGKDVKNSGVLERDAVMNYIKALNAKGKPFSASVDGRAVCKSVLDNVSSQVISAIKKAKTGSTILVNCANSKTVSKDIFKALKGKNVNVTFMDDYNNINITFNGKNIKKVVNFSLVNTVPNLTARKNICKQVKQNNLTYVYLKSTLPGDLTASIELNDSIVNSKSVYVYEYNTVTKKIYKVSKAITPSKSGYVNVKVNTNMVYFMTTKNLSSLSYSKALKAA